MNNRPSEPLGLEPGSDSLFFVEADLDANKGRDRHATLAKLGFRYISESGHEYIGPDGGVWDLMRDGAGHFLVRQEPQP